jgi:hypothetical protein
MAELSERSSKEMMDLKSNSDGFVQVKHKSQKRKVDEMEEGSEKRMDFTTIVKKRPNLPPISGDKLMVC